MHCSTEVLPPTPPPLDHPYRPGIFARILWLWKVVTMIAKCLAIYSTLLPTLSSHPPTPNKPEIRGYLGVHSRGEETDASPETTGNELNPVFVQAPSLPNKPDFSFAVCQPFARCVTQSLIVHKQLRFEGDTL